MGLRRQPRNEVFFTLWGRAGPNVVESAAILIEFIARAARALRDYVASPWSSGNMRPEPKPTRQGHLDASRSSGIP